MSKKRDKNNWDLPLLHPDHPRPVTRRQLLSQGFLTGAAFTVGGSLKDSLSCVPGRNTLPAEPTSGSP